MIDVGSDRDTKTFLLRESPPQASLAGNCVEVRREGILPARERHNSPPQSFLIQMSHADHYHLLIPFLRLT